MPYASITDLPDAVQKHLPVHAQVIYKEAFNHAYDEYAERKDRESLAHRVAWSAVKKKYQKLGDKWVKK